jgi:hypothetical protein
VFAGCPSDSKTLTSSSWYSTTKLGRRAGSSLRSTAWPGTVLTLVRTHGVAVRHPRLTAAECARIVELYQGGITQVEIANQFGRNPSLIWHVLERAGMKGQH